MRTRFQIVFYSMYRHIDRTAQEIAAGINEIANTDALLRQVEELVSDKVLLLSGGRRCW